MKKIVGSIFALCIMFKLCTSSTFARELPVNNKAIFEGVTEDGIIYKVYQSQTQNENAIINSVIHKNYSITVSFEGNVIPSATWDISISEGNVTYSGTLNLVSYHYDNLLWSKTTSAFYSGSLYAWI